MRATVHPPPVHALREEFADAPRDDPRWQLVEQIVASSSFAKCPRLSSFLLHICGRVLAGRTDGLNEQSLGEALFQRAPGYDSRDDSIIRAHATRLRQKLDEFFREEGQASAFILSLPRGGYVPVFQPRRTAEVPWPSLEAAAAVASPRRTRIWLAVTAVLMLVAGVWIVDALWQSGAFAGSPEHRLWARLFRADQSTLIVATDSSLVIWNATMGRAVRLDDYASGRYQSETNCVQPCNPTLTQSFSRSRYTSMAALEFATTLVRLPEAAHGNPKICYARDLRLDDLKQSNVILIGSEDADPWLGVIRPKMNFWLNDGSFEGPMGVMNRHPRGSELALYGLAGGGRTLEEYAAIAFLPNLNETGDVIVVQGFTLSGTQSAAEFLTDKDRFNALMAAAIRGRRTIPHFEILLKTSRVNGVGSRAEVVAWRIYS